MARTARNILTSDDAAAMFSFDFDTFFFWWKVYIYTSRKSHFWASQASMFGSVRLGMKNLRIWRFFLESSSCVMAVRFISSTFAKNHPVTGSYFMRNIILKWETSFRTIGNDQIVCFLDSGAVIFVLLVTKSLFDHREELWNIPASWWKWFKKNWF